MSVSLPNPSARFLRAAVAEQADLARHRGRLTGRRELLLAELRQLDDALAGIDERLGVLRGLTDDAKPGKGTTGTGPRIAPDDTKPGDERTRAKPRSAQTTPGLASPGPIPSPRQLLRGPAIREAAVKVAVGQAARVEALHYRRWYALLEEAGFQVAGKDPLAVFLTQITRSPVVRKTTQPGVYELDRQAPLRIRQRLSRLQAELREVAAAPEAPVGLAAVRARRHELDLAISQQERALEEALRVLTAPSEAPSEAAPNARAG